jgi:SAM-dependent methyltransferase
MREKIYLKDKQVLAFFDKKANPEFWDNQWQIDDLHYHITSCNSDEEFIPAVKKYLPLGSRVLEGGCGRGQLVHALKYQGYKAIGIDFAPKIVENIKQAVPDLDVRVGDLQNLPIEDNYLDGYISVGVIEHFWEGYYPILSEMKRTLKPAGFLFISFPHMSPLRNFKARFGFYENREIFYQFALNPKQVIQDLQALGFTLKAEKAWDGLWGIMDEFPRLKPWIHPIYDYQKYQILRPHLDRLLKPITSHCSILVMQKMS